MEKYPTYKRTKVNWWAILLWLGINVWVIFAYIYQWGNHPVGKGSLIISPFLFAILILARAYSDGKPVWKVIMEIDDKSFIIKTELYGRFKISIDEIKNIDVEQQAKVHVWGRFLGKQVVSIQLKSGKTNKFTIRDAQKVKEEIEMRMLIAKNN